MKPILATIALLLAVNGILHGQAVRTCTPQDWSGCMAGGVPKCDPYIRNKDGWIIGQADCAAVVSGYAQTKKPSATKDASGVSYFKTVDPCGSEAWASPVTFDESLKDGVYTARFVDICNKWRCYVTTSSTDTATIVCTKPHDVQGEKKTASQPQNSCGEGMHWAEKEHDKYGSHWICEKDAKP